MMRRIVVFLLSLSVVMICGEEFSNQFSERLSELYRIGFRPQTILDVGANSGDWTRMTSKIFKESKFHMVEGNDALSSSLDTVGFPYTIALVGDHNKTVEFFQSRKDRNKSGSTLYIEDSPAFRGQNYEKVVREMTTIDHIVKSNNLLGKIEFLKLDIQGAELPALYGAVETINSGVEFILCEASILQYNIGAPSIFDLHFFFESHNFVLYDIADLRYLGKVGLKLDRNEISVNDDGYYGKHLLQLDILWIRRTSKYLQKNATLYEPYAPSKYVTGKECAGESNGQSNHSNHHEKGGHGRKHNGKHHGSRTGGGGTLFESMLHDPRNQNPN